MKYIKFLLLVAFLSLSIYSQEKVKQEKPLYAVIPSTDVMVMIASQNDSPLQIENARVLYNLNTNRLSYQWDFRNKGKKPIVGFLVDAWHANGAGGTLTNSREAKKEILKPGGFVKDDLDEKQIVPLTKEIREQLKLNSKMRSFVVLIVRYVFFKDGTQYDGLKTSDLLNDFLGKYGDCIDEQEP
jgi:hypothetical protein